MDLEDLRTFVEVADTGGVAPGARRLGLSKSIVSRRLARLEEALGVQLLSRTTRGSAITEAGATFREHAMRIVAEIDAAQETLSPEGEIRGLLRIAAPLSFGTSQLAPVFAELARRHPQLQVETSYSDRFVDLVSEGFDCAVRLGFLSDSSLIARRIAAFRGRLVASPAYIAAHGTPLTVEDLAHHQAVTKKGEVWQIGDGHKTVTVRPRGRFFADNGEALLAAALAGVGIAALPDFLTDPHIAAGALVPLLADYPVPEAGMFVVRPPGAFPSRKIRVLIDILVEHFGKTD
ncbi:LysR family transcriptional regulator [Rhizobacter sp. Root1221]|uniref:LysR family transcriptional regulator n=1 Tax=Rhizobacter sp. Root1221 TaxID=1736433 RepID=UPI0006F4ED34|nr:LysR family transcriptional regulator [Rhizobacter sp. Root1221]KQV89778.1 LysR family transcriptional regulator [Rhizobacter sp. Root1221]